MSAERLVENAPRLPLRIAARVAWSSIKVRMSRSLVTVSSVVLAVAFLLVVLGGDIADRSVYRQFSAENRANVDVATMHDLLSQPRAPLRLLELLATDPEIDAWAAGYGVEVPFYETERAKHLVTLADWVADLKATDRFKTLGTQDLHDWLLHLDAEGAVERFLDTAGTFRGVRLPFEPPAIRELGASTNSVRAAVDALRATERARLERVAAHGGRVTILERIQSGDLPVAQTSDVGLPLVQELGAVDAQRYRAIQSHLGLRDLREEARAALKRINRSLPTLPPVTLPQLADGTLADRVAAFTQEYPALEDRAEAIVEAVSESGDLQALRGALADTPEIAAIDADSARARELEARVETETSKAMLALHAVREQLDAAQRERLIAALADRSRLDALAASFTASGFDPESASERTFWLLVLSLLVCIVGIVNSMMMAVTERFREIATMKCLGAMDGFILKAFLIESGSVGVVGAFLGSILGVLIVFLQSTIRYGATFWSAVPVPSLALAALAALVCGILLTIFGALLPAYHAARMHPIEAMRLET